MTPITSCTTSGRTMGTSTDISAHMEGINSAKEDIAQVFNALSEVYEGEGAAALQNHHQQIHTALDDHMTNRLAVHRAAARSSRRPCKLSTAAQAADFGVRGDAPGPFRLSETARGTPPPKRKDETMAIGDYTHNIGAIEDDAKNQKADLQTIGGSVRGLAQTYDRLSTRLAERLRHDKRIGQGTRECRQSAVRAAHRREPGQEPSRIPAVSSRH